MNQTLGVAPYSTSTPGSMRYNLSTLPARHHNTSAKSIPFPCLPLDRTEVASVVAIRTVLEDGAVVAGPRRYGSAEW